MEQFTNFKIFGSMMSAEVAANLAISDIFSGKVDSNTYAYIFDAIAYTGIEREIPHGKDAVKILSKGCGMRMCVRMAFLTSDIDFHLSLGQIAAAASLKKADVSYDIFGLGLGPQAMGEILKDFNITGDFTPEAYNKINNTIYKNLILYIKNNKESIIPTEICSYQFRGSREDVALTRSYVFAMNSIIKGLSKRDALDAARKKKLLDYMIWYAYNDIMPDKNDEDKPDQAEVESARKALSVKK